MTPAAQMSTLRPYLKKKERLNQSKHRENMQSMTFKANIYYCKWIKTRQICWPSFLKVPAKCSCSSHPVSAMISGATYVGVPQTV